MNTRTFLDLLIIGGIFTSLWILVGYAFYSAIHRRQMRDKTLTPCDSTECVHLAPYAKPKPRKSKLRTASKRKTV